MIVRCPKCNLIMPWTRQGRKVTVLCSNREMTSWIGKPPRKQNGFAIYATTDRSRCWGETYWVDGEDRLPKWRCGTTFIVRREHPEKL